MEPTLDQIVTAEVQNQLGQLMYENTVFRSQVQVLQNEVNRLNHEAENRASADEPTPGE